MGYQHLQQSLKLRETVLENRVMMGSMHVGLEGEENGLEKLTAFYARRASENVGLIVTGGAAVRPEGSGGGDDFMSIATDEDAAYWKPLTKGVHEAGGKIALQLFHAGRYAYKDMTGIDPVAPSALQSPINPDVPKALTEDEIEETIEAFATGARRAVDAGFDAVEIMGSEGYLINQFVSPVTNQRTDAWGGSFENRLRFPIEIARRVRAAVGPNFPVLFRMSGLDLIEGSTTEEETLAWAQALEAEGMDLLNIGIGWHESQVPTISMKVPRKKFVDVAAGIKQGVKIPVIASNRINDPQDAEDVLAAGKADMISMARPFLADPEIITKGFEGRRDEINTCIACNQACLDHVFEGRSATCLVNPEAGRELELTLPVPEMKKHVLIVGAGPAGLEAARTAALRGHTVTIADEKDEIGGQLNYSKIVPGKGEFYETIRYFRVQLEKLGVNFALGTRITDDHPLVDDADEIVVASGIIPRTPEIPGVDQPHVISYRDVFEGRAVPGERVVVIGGGGVACDVSLYMQHDSSREIRMLQRSRRFARGIGKTTRWATIIELKKRGVEMTGEVMYQEITPDGITFSHNGETVHHPCDTIVIASGQLANPVLFEALKAKGKQTHLIGGAEEALGLDAKKAIYDGTVIGRAI
ncbi:2,4-dienoyl-CoA reductase (NADPH2) [Salsuginibacillus halophilus]|uniref:2,4-dienoyl-CoA reductase (NADPH2) n=1 Tax=Salsuginibacillus halophilus TaxID=517424 RepID=A0A2P8HI29_9BACI|nr:NADPH-dependent 2,4-dienoyl-CoA reductase [Salsuginibacillus halophilus]PSL45873.1 2,4-dienoyl-CoA reductase (NADPH2) [Salsuginibacillus halophilus]